MSDSAKVHAVRDYLDKLDKGDVIGANSLVADNFVYNHNAKPGAAGFSAGNSLNKEQANEAQVAMHKNFKSVKTEIEDITEQGGKIRVRAKMLFELKVNEVPYTAEYEFDGDKIRAVHVYSESEFVSI